MAAINNSDAAEYPAWKKRKVESNKEEEDGDPFERLGDETIVEILVRVDDDKSLRRCILLNKRMSCLVPLADPVSIHIPKDPWPTDYNFRTHYVKVVGKLFLPGRKAADFHANNRYGVFCDANFDCFTKSNPPSLDDIIQHYIKTGSENLRSRLVVGSPIHQVTINLPPLRETVFGCRNYWTWNLEYSGAPGGLIKSCVILGSFRKLLGQKGVWRDDITVQIQMISRCMRFGAILRPMVERLVREHNTLCRVSIITECGMGRLHLGPEEIRNMKKSNGISSSSIMNNNPSCWKMKLNMKIWYCGKVGLCIVTDPEFHHNTVDVKIVIGSVFDRFHNQEDESINKMRTRMMKNKETLPQCSLQVTNSEWELWNCEINKTNATTVRPIHYDYI